ncbi:MAG: hypothetical protein HQ582_28675 [Planctomycetes bacterium]|nr:hypothetical protein [Planctomycetota bacterium]
MDVLVTYFLDTVLLMVLVAIFARDRRPKLIRLFFTGLGVAAAYCIYELIGDLKLGHMIVVPLVLVTGIVLMMYCRLKLKQAAVVAGLFFALHVVLDFALGFVF